MKEDLLNIPGVGKAMKEDFIRLGYYSVSSLKGADPEEMYERQCQIQKKHVDRCVLYVYRCAVYYADHDGKDCEQLNWWDFKVKNELGERVNE